MKHSVVFSKMIVAIILAFNLPANTIAQAPTTLDTSKMAYNQISSSLKLYVFPSKGQSNQQQKVDEYDCYNWAIKQSGIDPLHIPEVKAAPVEKGPDGSAVKGAAKGAVVGTAVGAIAGDTGEGAAIGAVAGGVGGIRQKRKANEQQQQQSQASAAQQQQAIIDSYKKAFSACIEGKGYTIK